MTSPTAILSYIVLAAALLFGGGARRDVPSDFIPELLAIPLLVMTLPGAWSRLRGQPMTMALLAGIIGLVGLHLVPLPAFLWRLLPGRDLAEASYQAAGFAAPFLPLSMQPREALKGGLAMIPAVALFFAALCLPSSARRVLTGVALAVGVVSLPLGILQLLGETGNTLYFYAITNRQRAVGFFANANHYAALFYALIPLAAALFAQKRQLHGIPYWAILAVIVVVCVLGLAISGSRSALLLGVLSLVLSGFLLMREALAPVLKHRTAWLVGLPVAASLGAVALAMGFSVIARRFDASDSVEEARLGLYASTWDLIWTYVPIGSGLGTFERIYQIYAPQSPSGGQIANHAHNDYLEIAMETGLLGVGLVAFFFIWLAARARAAFALEPSLERRLAIASVIAMALLSLHSAWDYPLRTIALSSLLGICAAFTFAPPPEADDPPRRSRRRRRSRASRMWRSLREFVGPDRP